jgi:hypothetical protein
MSIDFSEYAGRLNVINVFEQGNGTGRVTPRILYDPALGKVYPWRGGKGLIMHGTAGTNTLPYFTGGSVADGRYVCAHYLIPRDDYTIYKMVPDGFGCNHVGESSWYDPAIKQPLGSYFYGIECESRQNWQEVITPAQHIKSGLVWAYLCARDRMDDRYVLSHSQIADPKGRRSDPEAGLYRPPLFWQTVIGIRADWPNFWPARWTGNTPDL